jgi:hypothetical protein
MIMIMKLVSVSPGVSMPKGTAHCRRKAIVDEERPALKTTWQPKKMQW